MIGWPARVLAAAVMALGASAQAEPACPGSAEGYGRLGGPNAEISVRLEPAVSKVGQFFAVDIVVCRAPAGKTVQTIVVDATMPAHGHGMNYRPAVAQTGEGAFRATGLMLHMPGEWWLTFDVVQGDRRTRLALNVLLKP
jgi:hypothetical protein